MSNYPLLNLFWTMLMFFLWIMWFLLLFRALADVFQDHDLSGWAKAGWIVLLIVLPFIGVLIYVIARGGSMARRDAARAQQADDQFKKYVRDAAGTGQGPASAADELTRLARLRADGALSDEEFQEAKRRVLA